MLPAANHLHDTSFAPMTATAHMHVHQTFGEAITNMQNNATFKIKVVKESDRHGLTITSAAANLSAPCIFCIPSNLTFLPKSGVMVFLQYALTCQALAHPPDFYTLSEVSFPDPSWCRCTLVTILVKLFLIPTLSIGSCAICGLLLLGLGSALGLLS